MQSGATEPSFFVLRARRVMIWLRLAWWNEQLKDEKSFVAVT